MCYLPGLPASPGAWPLSGDRARGDPRGSLRRHGPELPARGRSPVSSCPPLAEHRQVGCSPRLTSDRWRERAERVRGLPDPTGPPEPWGWDFQVDRGQAVRGSQAAPENTWPRCAAALTAAAAGRRARPGGPGAAASGRVAHTFGTGWRAGAGLGEPFLGSADSPWTRSREVRVTAPPAPRSCSPARAGPTPGARGVCCPAAPSGPGPGPARSAAGAPGRASSWNPRCESIVPRLCALSSRGETASRALRQEGCGVSEGAGCRGERGGAPQWRGPWEG